MPEEEEEILPDLPPLISEVTFRLYGSKDDPGSLRTFCFAHSEKDGIEDSIHELVNPMQQLDLAMLLVSIATTGKKVDA